MKISLGYVSDFFFIIWGKVSVKLQCRLFWDFLPLVPVSEVHLCRGQVLVSISSLVAAVMSTQSSTMFTCSCTWRKFHLWAFDFFFEKWFLFVKHQGLASYEKVDWGKEKLTQSSPLSVYLLRNEKLQSAACKRRGCVNKLPL